MAECGGGVAGGGMEGREVRNGRPEDLSGREGEGGGRVLEEDGGQFLQVDGCACHLVGFGSDSGGGGELSNVKAEEGGIFEVAKELFQRWMDVLVVIGGGVAIVVNVRYQRLNKLK